MTTRRIAVVSAGLGHPSSTRLLADRLGVAVTEGLAREGVDAVLDVVELREHAHAITDNLLTGFAPPALERAIRSVTSADGLIAVTPIFSTSYSGLFKLFVDVLDRESLVGMPVLLGANAGTARHSLAIDYAIRPLFAYLRAEAVPTGVFAASEDWGGADTFAPRIARAADEFVAAVLRRGGSPGVLDPFDPANYLGEGRSFADLVGD